jgi:hypothetical protein
VASRTRGLVLVLTAGSLAGLLAAAAGAQPRAGITFGLDPIGCATSSLELARLIEDCVTRVMYLRGIEGNSAPELDARAAALVCRRTRTLEMSRALADCVRALLYEREGLGRRREAVTGEAAVVACRHATSLPDSAQVEDCMKRLLFTRGGLGYERTEMGALDAAYLCQGVPRAPLVAFPFPQLCQPPGGSEAVRFVEDCVRRLLYQREGLGERRPEVTPEAAAIACEGALSWWP